jgi:hypothetical protein
MPLGICGTCRRAFIFEEHAGPGQDCCPRCGTPLRLTTIREVQDLPRPPLHVSEGDQEKPEGPRNGLRA